MTIERKIPANELDLSFMTTESAWGKEVTDELNDRLVEIGATYDENGVVTGVEKRHLWGLYSYYTRDMRLSNLNQERYIYCLNWLGIAGDCLRCNYIHSFMTALSRVIDALELSQSVGGFLRRRTNTVTQESNLIPGQQDKQNKGLFGGLKKQK